MIRRVPLSQFRQELLNDFVLEGEYSDDEDALEDSSDSQNVRWPLAAFSPSPFGSQTDNRFNFAPCFNSDQRIGNTDRTRRTTIETDLTAVARLMRKRKANWMRSWTLMATTIIGTTRNEATTLKSIPMKALALTTTSKLASPPCSQLL